MDINNIYYPAPKQEYKVLVRCFTFNHSNYIEDALNGFAMQQTNFPFACLVMDDASTDGEQELIKAWMERKCDMERAETIDIPTSVVIIVPHKTNTSCTFAFYLLKQNLYKAKEEKMRHVTPWREKCEYEAMCEGDDYWIDSLKLQKQVDFLDNNPEYVMVYTNIKQLYQTKNVIINSNCGIEDNSYENLLRYNPIPTLTVMHKISAMEDYNEVINPSNKGWLLGDYPMWLWLSLQGRIQCLPENTGVYRVLDQSASHFKDYANAKQFALSTISIKDYFINLYPVKNSFEIEHANNHGLFCLSFIFKEYDEIKYYYDKLGKKTAKDKLKVIVVFVYNVFKKIMSIMRRLFFPRFNF